MSSRYDALPVSARLAWWGTAWLDGAIGPDELLDAVLGADVAHVVVGDEPGLVPYLARQRSAGASAIAAVFPAAGDPVGLRGPRDLSTAAIDAGEAVLLLGAGAGLVPGAVGRAVEWTPYSAHRRPPPDLGEADRGLRSALLTAARDLAALDVGRWRPEIADELIDLRASERLHAPPGVPPRCVDLAGRALRMWQVVELASSDDGAAVSAGEMARRREALDPLDRAARLALTAAFSPDGWPPRYSSAR
ncbi:MAG: hypothetical protein FWE71_03290 [Nocardioidaceae bacterium]|nr:hypothetical protein [Nocardioidaceae bacterium]MCL2612156.1 hypothetical protein [Nocardioidaceae bacterium]